jgi:capsular exopolysaccharide synthesis family protein
MASKTYKFTGKPGAEGRAPSGGGESYVAGVPLARVIPRMVEERVEAVMLSAPRSVAAERFRRLASMLDARNRRSQALVVTSAIPGEGKTTVAMNLALAFAAHVEGQTLIVDADLRRPTVHTWLKQPPGLGLAEVLSGRVGLDHAIHKLTNSSLEVLPAGDGTQNALELLSSNEARELLDQLRQRYRQIVIDTPPIVPFTDADSVARHCDGVLFVARAGVTGRKAYQQAVSMITATTVVGVVFNEYESNLADGRTSEDTYYYSNYRPRGRK